MGVELSYYIEAKSAAQYLKMHRTALTIKNDLFQEKKDGRLG